MEKTKEKAKNNSKGNSDAQKNCPEPASNRAATAVFVGLEPEKIKPAQRVSADMDGDDLSRDLVAKAGLLILTGRGVDNLDIVDAALLDKPGLRNQFSTYIKRTATGAALEKLEQKLAAAPSDQKEGVVGDIMEKLRAEGEVKGRAEGEAHGIAKGRKQDLSRLLERRFGDLPAAVKAQIADRGGGSRPA